MARLQLLVNHYREPDDIVRRFLMSVEMQEAADGFEVVIYSDGTDLSPAILGGYSFPIRHKSLPHGGVCATRNALMDDATADYLMFCDIDDCFHGTLGLYRILKAIDDVGSDVIASPYEAEYVIGGRLFYRRMECDTLRVHGKAFRRGYLTDNDIRFPDMEFSGDMMTMWLAFNLGGSVCWIMDSFYVWKDYAKSVTRANPNHSKDTYGVMLRCYELLYENLGERGRYDLQQALMGSVFSMLYLNSHDPAYTEGDAESVKRFGDAVSSFVGRYGHVYLSVPDEVRREMYVVATTLHRERKGCGVGDIPRWLSEIS